MQDLNLTAKAKERRDAALTIGPDGAERVFHGVSLTPNRAEEVRRLNRDAQRAVRVATAEQARYEKLLEEKGADSPEVAKFDVEKMDELVEESEAKFVDSLYAQIAVLARDQDGQAPELDFLRDHLDQRDAPNVLNWLSSDDEGKASGDPEKTGETPTT